MTNDSDSTGNDPEPTTRRRAVFPWAYVGVLVAVRVGVEIADVASDIKVVINYALIALGTIGLAVWYLFRGRAAWPVRLAVAAAPFAAVAAVVSLYELRMAGDGTIAGLHRRTAAKADQLLDKPQASPSGERLTDWGPGPYDYPRFLGAGPWAEAVGPPIDADWQASPPKELWRRPVGAGWSAFAVQGAYAVTQEQRGDDELVVCYRLDTGDPVWSHADPVRFDPEDFGGQMGRVGPRATPTIVGDRVYTQGATGLVNCLDGPTGEVVWRLDTAQEYGAAVPVWGKSGSPLYLPEEGAVDRALLIVNVGAPADTGEGAYDASLVALDAATGEEVWSAGWRQTSYASPAVARLAGELVVLQTVDDHLHARRAADGELLFSYPWRGQSDNMPSCSQPIPLEGDRLLLSKGYGFGASLVQVSRDGDNWAAEPLWSPPIKRVLQTKFSNCVVRDGFAFALSDKLLQCVEIESGKIAWRARRSPAFEYGQVLLCGEHLLVTTEDSGEIVLVEASPDSYRELASLQVLADGETNWNNPVVAGDVLLVRNSVEAAAYRLPTAAVPDDVSDGGSAGESGADGA
ncbi:PQQ-binding-like beta-propeller repeat protein [Botrimarina sp.]|uniref:outer membrane protein assembly factor BamB family protein n=1 Tax=Botrimarina sp. TaxID=2795802 RepID=UPI0032ED1822